MSPLTQQPASPVPTEARAPPLSPSSNGLFNGCRPLLSSLWLSINDVCKNLALLLPLPLSLLPLIYSTISRNFPYQVTTSVVAVGYPPLSTNGANVVYVCSLFPLAGTMHNVRSFGAVRCAVRPPRKSPSIKGWLPAWWVHHFGITP